MCISIVYVQYVEVLMTTPVFPTGGLFRIDEKMNMKKLPHQSPRFQNLSFGHALVFTKNLPRSTLETLFSLDFRTYLLSK
jgi:hypothetical protein